MKDDALFAVGAVAAAALASAAAWRLLRPRYRLPTPADEVHQARTGDGWDLALYRYRPRVLTPGREPVILCHGMLSNRYNVDLDEQVSLARHLREAGFDAWVLELRGHGRSRRGSEPAGPEGRASRRASFDWNLDDYIQRDVPAAVRYVQQASGSQRVHWFGHSMGGMILYGACLLPGMTRSIRSAVLGDAPASFAPLRAPARLGRVYARLFPAVPPALVLPFLGPVSWLLPEIMARRYGLGDRRLIMSLLANAIVPWASSRALQQICDMLESGCFRSADGALDYEQGASRIDFPLLVLSAPRKKMNEEAIRCGFERAASKRKQYIRLSRAHGYSIDYTHANLLVAPTSPLEVFPAVSAWFAVHSSA